MSKPGFTRISISADRKLKAALVREAERRGRTLADEVTRALETHVMIARAVRRAEKIREN